MNALTNSPKISNLSKMEVFQLNFFWNDDRIP